MNSKQLSMQSVSGQSTSPSLLERAQSESQGPAWDQVMRQYEPFVRRTLARMQIEKTEIDDVSQQVLAKLWKELVRFKVDKSRARFRTWLTHLIRNVAINDYWRRKRAKRISSEGLEMLANHALDSSEIEELIESEWQQYVVGLGMKQIRKIFSGKAIEVFLRCQKGEAIEEIGESLKLTSGSVYVLKYRVKKRLIDEVIQIRKSLEPEDLS